MKQEKGKGLLTLPFPSHSGRQRRPHKGLRAFQKEIQKGLLMRQIAEKGVAHAANPHVCRLFGGVAGAKSGTFHASVFLAVSLDISKELWYVFVLRKEVNCYGRKAT